MSDYLSGEVGQLARRTPTVSRLVSQKLRAYLDEVDYIAVPTIDVSQRTAVLKESG